MKVVTDYPERLPEIGTLYLGSSHRPYRVQRIRPHRKGMLIQFEGIADRTMAEELREQMVYIHISDAVPLEEGEFYLYELEGILVVTDEGVELGHLSGLIETGANDVYIITTPEGREILIPAIEEVIREIDLHSRRMIVHLLEGLL